MGSELCRSNAEAESRVLLEAIPYLTGAALLLKADGVNASIVKRMTSLFARFH